MVAWIIIGVVVLLVLATLARTIRIVPQARAGVIERLGRYNRTLSPGLAIVVPFVDRPPPPSDLREQGVPRAPPPGERPARAGRLVCAAAGDHRGQPRRLDRLGHLLPGHRREVGDVRDRQ